MLTKDRDFACVKDKGSRPYQEDEQGFSYLEIGEEQSGILSIVSDGMGGENAGNVASALVIKEFVYACHEDTSAEIPTLLKNSAIKANDAMRVTIGEQPLLEGMGATLVATLIVNNVLYWVSVGDSPLFLVRNEEIKRLNEDHSMMPLLKQQVTDGELKESELATHPERNVLRAAMTGDEIDLMDVSLEGELLEEGDVVLCASDGVDTLSAAEILAKLNLYKSLSAQEMAVKIVQAVKSKDRPRQDNIAVNITKYSATLSDEIFLAEGKTRLIERT